MKLFQPQPRTRDNPAAPDRRTRPRPAPAEPEPRAFPGWGTLGAVGLLYAVAVIIATWPVARGLASVLPSRTDPLQHIWVMRWYKTCLLEGRAPWICPEIQYPKGAPLGNFSPLHLQALLYLPLSMICKSDILCYNLLWLAGFIGTGLGTFALAWWVVRDRACAAFAGLAAMLSTPMLIHGFGHLELIHLGAFPIFLMAWLRFLDRPGRGRLVLAVGSYLLVAMSAAYFVVLTAIPAAFAVAWIGVGAWRAGERSWFRGRLGWLAAFAASTAAPLALLFINQLWAATHGQSLARPWVEFRSYGAPLWSFAVPIHLQRLSALLPCDIYKHAGFGSAMIEKASYLGIATLALLQYAAFHRVRLPRAGFWWAVLGLLVLLASGASWQFGPVKVELPAAWLWRSLAVFRLIRMPARFNLLAAVVASILAAAGLKHLLGRVAKPWARAAIVGSVVALTVWDLSVSPFGERYYVPDVAWCYDALVKHDPHASFLDAPIDNSNGAHPLSALCGYWQAIHRGRTTAGYSGCANLDFDNELVFNSPFSAARLADPDYLRNPDGLDFGPVAGVHFDDYAWLYLTAFDLRYVILHRRSDRNSDFPVYVDRVAARLKSAQIYDDGKALGFSRAKLPPPSRPVLVTGRGWRRRSTALGPLDAVIGPEAAVIVYNPDPNRPVRLAIEARAFRRSRTVRLLDGPVELARWTVGPDALQHFESPPLRLPQGLRTLTIASDGQDRPRNHSEAIDPALSPFSLRVATIRLTPIPPAVAQR